MILCFNRCARLCTRRRFPQRALPSAGASSVTQLSCEHRREDPVSPGVCWGPDSQPPGLGPVCRREQVKTDMKHCISVRRPAQSLSVCIRCEVIPLSFTLQLKNKSV